MSQLSVAVSHLTAPSAPASGSANLSPTDGVIKIAAPKGYTKTLTASATITLSAALTDNATRESITFTSLESVLIKVVKTAATVSGTFSVVMTGVGHAAAATRTIVLTSLANVAAAQIGDTIEIAHCWASLAPLAVTTNTLAFTLTSPVGFEVQVVVLGEG